MENVFRIGSDAHLSMIKEAKKLYSRGVLDLCEEDEALMETHLGEFDLYENEIVPLDLPMLEEQMDIEDEIANEEFGMDYDQLGSNEKEWVRDEIDNMQFRENLNKGKAIITFKNDYEVKMNTGEGYDDDFEYFEAGEREQVYILDKNDKRTHVEFGDGTNAFIPSDVISVQEKSLSEVKIGDIVKIDAAYGGGKGEVESKVGSFVVINGESYHEPALLSLSPFILTAILILLFIMLDCYI